MKKIFSLAIFLILALPLLAGLKTMNYQAVINDADGKPVADSPIGLMFTIFANEIPVYSEETTVVSDSRGLIEWQIGSTSENGLSDINWKIGNFVLRVSVDVNGGTDYNAVYDSSVQSVPTAFYAEKSGDTEELTNEIFNLSNLVNHIQYDLVQYNTDMIKDNKSRIEWNEQEIAKTQNEIVRLEESGKSMLKDLYNSFAGNKDLIDKIMNNVTDSLSSLIGNLEMVNKRFDMNEEGIKNNLYMINDLRALVDKNREEHLILSEQNTARIALIEDSIKGLHRNQGILFQESHSNKERLDLIESIAKKTIEDLVANKDLVDKAFNDLKAYATILEATLVNNTAAIKSHDMELAAIKAKNEDLQYKNMELEKELATNKSDIVSLVEQIHALQNEVEELKKK